MTSGSGKGPSASSDVIKKRMQEQRQKDTAPEMAVRRILHSKGCRYRVDYRLPDLRRRADIAFTRLKLAVFIDGCFWHSCPDHGSLPKKNREWWDDKLQKNVDRDRDTDRKLHEAGWEVLRIWEHQDPSEAADEIIRLLRFLRHGGCESQ